MTKPKDLYDTEIVYRTPSGKLAYFSKVLAGTLEECDAEIRRVLSNEQRYGKRRVASIVGISCRYVGKQIQTS